MKNNIKVHFSSDSNEWATPKALFDRIQYITGIKFNLDPCCTVKTKKCPYGFTQDGTGDGLKPDWSFYETVFCNPPYGREIGKWVKKAYEEWKKGAAVVLLIPSRTDTRWWHDYCMKASSILFIKGRVKFEQGGKTSLINAPFPSCVVIFNEKPVDFFPRIGTLVI